MSIKGASTLLKVLISLFFIFPETQASSQSPGDNSPGYYGAPSVLFQAWAKPRRSQQKKSNWCWAASAEMVLRYHGIKIRQKKLVRLIFQKLGDEPASMRQILQALDGYCIRKGGRCYKITANLVGTAPQPIVKILKEHWVLIAGLFDSPDANGHAYVLYGTDSYRKSGKVHIQYLYLQDPLPDSGSEGGKKMRWDEFVSKQPEILLLQKRGCY
ncbi:MAG: C39 family peptidase [Lewinellaceae bacterium]|nr:C39 family peptidase [Lewinellaceae bacterium]MCB9296430.1 C39 family peptidase [Lewinellaceae bacterium]